MTFAHLIGRIPAAVATGALCATASWAQICPENTGVPQFNPANHDTCMKLWPEVAAPSVDGKPKPLNSYEASVGQFFNLFCHRDPELKDASGTGWAMDKDVRDTGPFTATQDASGNWVGSYHGYHAPVVIWYSPNMVEWLEVNRPSDPSKAPATPAPVPDGAIIAKEMYTPPAARCAGQDIATLKPANGIAYMIRDSKAAHDGWFWGYFGFFDGDTDPNIDWPQPHADRPLNAPNYAGFGQYCLNCHASAVDNSTFSSLDNVAGYPGKPLTFLSANWIFEDFEGASDDRHNPADNPAPQLPGSTPLSEVPDGFSERFTRPPGSDPVDVAAITLPSMAYDNVWAEASTDGVPPVASEYLTSDQCAGCHDAGSTGLAFDMTKPNPHGTDLINLSPFATWRNSPMGLAGRDPIFFGQLASEEVFHPEYVDTIWNTCFGCHGIMGQRQFQLDQAEAGTSCADSVFTPDMVTAIPYDGPGSAGQYDAAHAKYGALARDGISCTACHRAALTPDQIAEVESEAQNSCILARQKELNEDIGGLTGFGKSFTGSFLVAGPDVLYGPFEDPKVKPMQHAIGSTPTFDTAIASSEQCGTCHTVHLPVLWPRTEGQTGLNVIADTYEQTTYPEWLMSDFRTGTAAFLPDGQILPGGAGATPVDCAGCHLESHDENGEPFRSKIASIQEVSNMPLAANVLPAEDVDLPVRDGFARHTLVGLNLFLVKMAEQFPEILGLMPQDPMLTSKGQLPIARTQAKMVENAQSGTASIAVTRRNLDADTLTVDLRIDNKAGHKFPSGVSFRRAFVDFEVLDATGAVIWQSGRTDDYGILIDDTGTPLVGELWYDAQCKKTVTKADFQPHYQTITKPGQVQIYQEVKLDPGDPEVETTTPQCGDGAPVADSANLTTSFLSICHTPKDNRLMPAGTVDKATRVELARAMGLVADGEAERLADEIGATGVGDDPDYVSGGGDSVTYAVPVSDLASAPAAVRATLYYQATPPFFLQDRFCNGKGANRDRLFHLSGLLDTDGTPIEDWKFRMVSTGRVALTP